MLRGMILARELVGDRGLRPPAAEQLGDRAGAKDRFSLPLRVPLPARPSESVRRLGAIGASRALSRRADSLVACLW